MIRWFWWSQRTSFRLNENWMRQTNTKKKNNSCSPSKLASRSAMIAFLMNIQCLGNFYIQIIWFRSYVCVCVAVAYFITMNYFRLEFPKQELLINWQIKMTNWKIGAVARTSLFTQCDFFFLLPLVLLLLLRRRLCCYFELAGSRDFFFSFLK